MKSFPTLFFALLFALIPGFTSSTQAQTTWAAASAGDWNTPGSWNPATVPGVGISALITNSGTFTVTYTAPMVAANIASLTLGGASSVPTLTLTAGGFNVAGTTSFTDSSAEVININNGGVMTNNTLSLVSRGSIVNVNSGGILTNGTTQVADNGSNDGSNELKINSGATASLGNVTIGRHTESSSLGLQIGGGTVTANSIDVGNRNSYATMAVSGGTLTNAGNLRLGTGSATAGREIRYSQTGGTVGCAGTVDLAVSNSYTTWFTVAGSSTTLYASGIRLFPNPASSAVARFTNSGNIYLGATGFNFDNSATYTVALNDQSVLGATADWSGNVNMLTTSGTVTFKAADPAGTPHNITLTNVISGGASIAKTGGGTLGLYGANTYTGGTTITAGTLQLGNASALPKGALLTMGGSGTSGTLDLAGFNAQVSGIPVGSGGVAANQLITNSSAVSASTLTFSNTLVSANFAGIIAGGTKPISVTVLGDNLTLSAPNNYAGNLFISNGKLALGAAGASFTGPAIVLSNSAALLDATGMGGLTLGAGQSLSGYGTVIGNVTAANCAITPGTNGGGGTLAFTNNLTLNGSVTSQFDLEVSPATPGGDQIIVTGALNVSGTNTITMNPLSGSLHQGTYHLIVSGSVGSGGATNFLLLGNPGVGLTAALNVTGTGVDLVVNAVAGTQRTWVGDGVGNLWDFVTTNWLNSGSPDVFTNGDAVTFDDTGSSAPAVNLTGTLLPASVLVNASSNYTFAGAGKISGTATLTVTNTGTLTVLTTNDCNGFVTVSQGTLKAGNGTVAGSLGTGAVTDNGVLMMNEPNNSTFSNLVSGTGVLVQAGPATLTLAASNTYSGGTLISAGTLQIGTGGTLGGGKITNNAALVDNSSGSLAIASVISGSGSLTVQNGGTLTLTGSNTFGGSVTVSSATLMVNNTNGSGTGGGAVVASGTATLGGSGTMTGPVTINSGATLAPGNAVGTLTINSNLTVNSGAKLSYTLGSPGDLVVVNGNLSLGGTVNLTAGAGFTTQVYPLFTYTGNLNAFTLAVGTMPATYLCVLDTNTPGVVNLVVTKPATNLLAFPEAVGFGAYATGGHGGSVYHVVNLNDSGTGSFRDAVSSGHRTVVFDVGGYINLASAVSMQSSITVAGQTAPGDGIGIMGREVSFDGRTNIIFRHFRFRQGTLDPDSSKSGINLLDATNVILDHVSIEFAQYDNIDAVGCVDITLMNSIDADPIGQQFCAHFENVGANCCIYNTVFADNHGRAPMAKINCVFINNVAYNYGYAYTVANTSGHFTHDIINNYFIAGPATSSAGDDFYQMDSNQQIYSAGNLLDSDKSGVLNGNSTAPGGVVVLSSPWSTWTTNITTLGTTAALRRDISLSGAWPHDQVDNYVLGNVKSYGTGGPANLPDSQTVTGLGNSGYGTLNGGVAPVNTSGDGIPDYWKVAMGLNTNLMYNNDATNTFEGIHTNYTTLDIYLNWLGALHAIASENTALTVDLRQYAAGFTNVSPVFAVSNGTNGTIALLGDGHTAQFTPNLNFFGMGGFTFTVSGSDGTSMTNSIGVLVTVGTLVQPQPLIWQGDGVANTWDSQTTSNWDNAGSPAVFNPGDFVTFDDTGSNTPAINLVGALKPASVTVNASQNYTFGGTGSLSGAMNLAQLGTGVLTINTSNNYTGDTTVDNGTIVLNGVIGGNSVTVSAGATLTGTGSISGSNAVPVTVEGDGTIAPGPGLVAFTIAGPLTLESGSTAFFEVSHDSATNDTLRANNVIYSGALAVTNLSGSLTLTDSFKLFYASNYSGTFDTIVPSTPGPGLLWDTTSLPTNGTLRVMPLSGQSAQIAGAANMPDVGFQFSATGPINAPYRVLASTNAALPLAQWTPVITNAFDGLGQTTFLDTNAPAEPLQFYRLVIP